MRFPLTILLAILLSFQLLAGTMNEAVEKSLNDIHTSGKIRKDHVVIVSEMVNRYSGTRDILSESITRAVLDYITRH